MKTQRRIKRSKKIRRSRRTRQRVSRRSIRRRSRKRTKRGGRKKRNSRKRRVSIMKGGISLKDHLTKLDTIIKETFLKARTYEEEDTQKEKEKENIYNIYYLALLLSIEYAKIILWQKSGNAEKQNIASIASGKEKDHLEKIVQKNSNPVRSALAVGPKLVKQKWISFRGHTLPHPIWSESIKYLLGNKDRAAKKGAANSWKVADAQIKGIYSDSSFFKDAWMEMLIVLNLITVVEGKIKIGTINPYWYEDPTYLYKDIINPKFKVAYNKALYSLHETESETDHVDPFFEILGTITRPRFDGNSAGIIGSLLAM